MGLMDIIVALCGVGITVAGVLRFVNPAAAAAAIAVRVGQEADDPKWTRKARLQAVIMIVFGLVVLAVLAYTKLDLWRSG
jgi:hypothetical protein